MQALHPDAELAPRDIVARGVFAEIAGRAGRISRRAQHPGARFAEEFPSVMQICLSAGSIRRTQLIPVCPAAHYHMGGVWTDARGRTSLGGLWAVGEVASTGVHGANRLASNSLLEAVVFAARVAEDLSARRRAAVRYRAGRILPAQPRAAIAPSSRNRISRNRLREPMTAHRAASCAMARACAVRWA